ncbi:MAG TPA: hypothetical protein VM536_06215 [Chloroflexia bacterium]|nr:hypothetical protein [Chloroflexia bacterium]
MLRSAGGATEWDLPQGALPAGGEPVLHGTRLLSDTAGVEPADTLGLFGIVHWGAGATPGAGWTACLFGEVGRISPLPRTSGMFARAFLPVSDLVGRGPANDWRALRRDTLEAAASVFTTSRDYWLLQTLDAVSMGDLDDVLDP